ncbi:death on curing protein [Enterococcus faecium]|nr:death on curing protein [Enterococcus faecium]
MRYLSTKEIIKINAKVILRHSPGEMIGVKDANALDETCLLYTSRCV